MRHWWQPLILAFMVIGVRSGRAYELATHGCLTFHAYQRSVAGTDYLVNGPGIINDTLGDNYYDVYRDEINTRTKRDFEQTEPRMPKGVDPVSIVGWLMRGAIREDDVPVFFGSNPQDDPYGQIFRVVNHFYDPRNDRPLTVGIPLGKKAPDWAIGAGDAFADSNAPDQYRRNHFTVFDAREAMFRALTGLDKSGSKAIGAGGAAPDTPADKEAVRKAYWATTFRALGDLVHLIQDMAQPQHTRNDPHAGSADYKDSAGPLGHKSFYEKYIEAHVTPESGFTTSNGHRYTLDSLVYESDPPYPTPHFNDYESYFSTRNIDTTLAGRRGMADYSNRGFFSVGKNLGQGDYDSPPNTVSSYSPRQIPVDSQGVTVDLLEHSVFDSYISAESGLVPLTAWGAWNGALEAATSEESFTLVRENYDAMAKLLIPRAVAYSAGLIDYFFRGRLEITLPREGVYSIVDHGVVRGIDEGFTRVKLNLLNTTPAIDDGKSIHAQNMGPGKLYAVAKYRRNPCYQPDLSGEHVASGAVINGCSTQPNPTANEEIAVSEPVDVQSVNVTDPQPFSFDFTANPIPLNATDLYLQVVFRGQLGSEADAVVVATRDISEPTFFDMLNSTDYLIDSNNTFQVNTDPWIVSGIGIAFNDSYSFVAQMNALQVSTYARVAVLVDSSSAKIPVTVYNAIDQPFPGVAKVNINQLDTAGNPQTTPFNLCDTGDTLTTYRGTNTLSGTVWFGGTPDPDGQRMCPLIPSLTQFSVLDPVPVDKINF